jgi:hypothetical protein
MIHSYLIVAKCRRAVERLHQAAGADRRYSGLLTTAVHPESLLDAGTA